MYEAYVWLMNLISYLLRLFKDEKKNGRYCGCTLQQLWVMLSLVRFLIFVLVGSEVANESLGFYQHQV